MAELETAVETAVETENGEFAFENVSNGTYLVKAETANGSKTMEITVFNADISDIAIVVEATSATIYGDAKVEKRDGTLEARVWVNVEFYDGDGLVSKGVEQTIKNISALGSEGMRETDAKIIEIMTGAHC